MEAMLPVAAVITVLETVLFFALLALMIACGVYLIRTRQEETLPEAARKSGVGMVVSYVAGLALFFEANAVPNEMEAVKILSVVVSVIGMSAVPAVISALLLAGKTLPTRVRPFAAATTLTSGVLFFCLAFAVWTVYLVLYSPVPFSKP